jgi:pyruvate dehydrogenase E1 component alpha subunit
MAVQTTPPGSPGHSASPANTSDPDVIRVLRDDGTLDPAFDPHLTPAEIIAIYEHLVLVRTLDERLVTLQRQGRIGFHIGSLGEEAAIIGSAAAVRAQDWLFPCYREFGAALWRGMSLQAYINNMFGNASDPAKGRQMPDHYTCRAAKFGSISSPIGTQITQAVGFAWAAKIKKDDLVSLVYFGEGATSSAEFHNGMNFAGVFKTPTVFFCRNNGWAISVPVERQTASSSFAVKGIAYGIPGVRCDGNDLFAVYKCTRDAVAHVTSGKGPILVEAMTYRLSGHSTSDDPKAYRKDVEVEAWKKRDPIARVQKHLVSKGAWDDARQSGLESRVEAVIKEAITAAEKLPLPALETMFEDVFAEPPWHLQEQRDALVNGPRAKGH